MRHLPSSANENVLVGYATSDDAGVYQVRNDLAIVQTVDFFTPIVDDPYDFGRIAAANSFSDIYAMGATPISAVNIAAFPIETLGASILTRILQGGAQIAKQAGAVILGGHTIKDNEPKFGMAVVGTVHPKNIVTNAGARPGDIILLTKPLGTGILTTARKRSVITGAALHEAITWMTMLNDGAARAMLAAHAHAATDVTGFGLLGHAYEVARASKVSLTIHAQAVPVMKGVLELIAADSVPGGTTDNAAEHASFTRFSAGVPRELRLLLSDAQTSGGLLIAVEPSNRALLQSALREAGCVSNVIGSVHTGSGISVE